MSHRKFNSASNRTECLWCLVSLVRIFMESLHTHSANIEIYRNVRSCIYTHTHTHRTYKWNIYVPSSLSLRMIPHIVDLWAYTQQYSYTAPHCTTTSTHSWPDLFALLCFALWRREERQENVNVAHYNINSSVSGFQRQHKFRCINVCKYVISCDIHFLFSVLRTFGVVSRATQTDTHIKSMIIQ